jgi:hypothetical protein
MKEIFSRMSAKEKIGLAIAAAIVFVAFTDRLLINPMSSRMRQLNNQIQSEVMRLKLNQEYINQKDAVSAEYGKYSGYTKKSGSDEEEQTKMLGEIENLSRQAGVPISNMKQSAPQAMNSYKKYEVKLDAEGSMDAVVNFLYLVSASPQLLRAENVTLSKDKDSDAVRASVTVTKIVVP